MAAPISQQLEDLLNPLPKFVDPEDDQDEETKAKVIEKFDEGEDEDEGVAVGALRKRVSVPLSEMDRRYAGKATSRKQLLQEAEGSGEEEDEDEEYSDEDDGDEEDGKEEDDDDDDEEDGEEDENEEIESVEEGDEDDSGTRMKNLVMKLKGTDISLPTETDLVKFTQGMDDLGESEEEEEEGDLTGEGEDEYDEGEEDEDDTEEDEGEEEVEDSADDGGAVMTFSKEKVSDEVEKGKAVKNQLALWDQLLEGRIKLQKALLIANQLPQSPSFPEFKRRGGSEFAGALKNSHKALKALQRSLLELQDQLLCQNADTRAIALGETAGPRSEDEEVHSDQEEDEEMEEEAKKPPKRKLEMSDYPDFMAKRFAAFQPHRDTTLQKWHDKTRLTMGKMGKGFAAFDRNILTQVEQVLMDKERLLRRTQTKRTEYRVLGRANPTASAPAGSGEEAEEVGLKANAHLKDLDEEIFDDDDFYHQLLRELIERKTNAVDPNDQVAMGRQWLAIQKLRSKIKKKVDTKASKGRKVRFHVHSKLVNFMAPIDHSSMNDDARTELYRSLFGKNSSVNGTQQE